MLKSNQNTKPPSPGNKASTPKEEKSESKLGELFPIIETSEGIPSQGKCYPEVFSIKYRPYAWGEIKQLSQSKISGAEFFTRILQGITTKGFKREDLTLGDFLYISLLRKISTLGDSSFQVQYPCFHCGQLATYVGKLMDIEFNDLTAPQLPVILPIEGDELHFKPLTIGAFIWLMEREKEEDHLNLMAASCINHPFEEAYDLIYNLPPAVGSNTIEIDKYMDHGLKPVKVKCSNEKCKAENILELDGGDIIIRPFRRPKVNEASRIRFGS